MLSLKKKLYLQHGAQFQEHYLHLLNLPMWESALIFPRIKLEIRLLNPKALNYVSKYRTFSTLSLITDNLNSLQKKYLKKTVEIFCKFYLLCELQ